MTGQATDQIETDHPVNGARPKVESTPRQTDEHAEAAQPGKEADVVVQEVQDIQETQDIQEFKLRGGSFTLLLLRLVDIQHPDFSVWLERKIAQAPYFFQHAPLVLDLEDAPRTEAPAFADLVAQLGANGLVIVGVQNGSDEQNQAAIAAGLSVFPVWRSTSAPKDMLRAVPKVKVEDQAKADAETKTDTKTEEESAAPTKSEPTAEADGAAVSDVKEEQKAETEGDTTSEPGRETASEADAEPDEDLEPRWAGASQVLDKPVRSGRQIYARGSDLVVRASVSPGGEVLADGHVHIYGPLRGRAFAGVGGDTSARIFCHSLEAELVAIAGYWLVRDDMSEDVIGKPVQIFLDGEEIVIEPEQG